MKTIDSTLVSEIKAGHELLGELLKRVIEEEPTRPIPARVAEGSSIKKAAPRASARGTTPPVAGGRRTDMSDPRLQGKTELVREFNGWRIVVHVLPEAGGFEWGGKVWASLSAIAKAVTGTSRNGFEFFGLAD